MPTSITAALRQLKATSEAAGASVMGPALRERIDTLIESKAWDPHLWDQIRNCEDGGALSQILKDCLVGPVEAPAFRRVGLLRARLHGSQQPVAPVGHDDGND